MLIGAALLALLLAVGFGARRIVRRRPALAAGAVALIAFTALTPGVYAHGDEPHGDEPATPRHRFGRGRRSARCGPPTAACFCPSLVSGCWASGR
jgi:hypothetical protein